MDRKIGGLAFRFDFLSSKDAGISDKSDKSDTINHFLIINE